MIIEKNITDRTAAEELHRVIGELLFDAVPKLPSGESCVMFFRLLKESAEKNLPACKPKQLTEEQREKIRNLKLQPNIAEAEGLIDEIESMAGDICENGQEFAESVLERTKSIRESIEKAGRATEGQITALENMAEGLRAWFHD